MASTESSNRISIQDGNSIENLWVMVDSVSRSRVCDLASTQTKYAVPALRHDIGVYVGNKALPLNPLEKGSFLERHQSTEKCVVPLATKTITTLLRPGGSGIVFWQLSVTELQAQECAAVIVACPEAPSYKAVLPMWYLTQHCTGDNAWAQPMESFEIRMNHLIHTISGFPPEWTPFVLPDRHVGEALESLRAYALGEAGLWMNPSNGVVFKGVPRPKAIGIADQNSHAAQISQPVALPSISDLGNVTTRNLRFNMEGPDVYSQAGPINSSRKGFGASHPDFEGGMHGGYGLWASEVFADLFRAKGQGLLLNLGRLNPVCEFAFVAHDWSSEDKHRFDSAGELPRRAWEVESGILVIPVHFVGFYWTNTSQPIPQCSLKQQEMITNNRHSIVIGDAFPPSGLRMPHGRFLIPSDLYPAADPDNDSEILRLRNNRLVDEFMVDPDDLPSTLTAMTTATIAAEMGHSCDPVEVGQCTALLGHILQRGVDTVGHHGLSGTKNV
ncbi:MAG: hypothetical protein Q9172_001108 [Xanthocarpia lactea]